jgi:hypothetical protein
MPVNLSFLYKNSFFVSVSVSLLNTNSLFVLLILINPLDVLVRQVPLAVGQEPLQLLSVGQLGQLLLSFEKNMSTIR